jgi:glutathione synthase/RimK-type ligase-like ATP-grasp enzyme
LHRHLDEDIVLAQELRDVFVYAVDLIQADSPDFDVVLEVTRSPECRRV